mgnify:CR=1 FL=1
MLFILLVKSDCLISGISNAPVKSIFEKSKTKKFKNDLNRVENLVYDSKKNKLLGKMD